VEIDRRYGIPRRKPDELIPPTEEERIGANRQSRARLLGDVRERRIDVAFVTGSLAGEAHFQHSKRSRAGTERHARGLRRGEEEGRADHAVALCVRKTKGTGGAKLIRLFCFTPINGIEKSIGKK
jgi:hypothetical protein